MNGRATLKDRARPIRPLSLRLGVWGVLLASLVLNARAQVSGNFDYSVSGGSVTITGYTNTTSAGAVTIPGTIAGDPVTSIGDYAFTNNSSLTSITIPSSVTSIGNGSFADTSLSNVIIPASVSSIGINAFASCSGLTTITFLGNAPTSVDFTAFQGDSNASIVYYPGTTGWTNPFAGLPAAPLPYTYTISGGAAYITVYSGSGGAVTIPSSIAGEPVVAIGSGAFAGSGITGVVIPASVTSIGPNAFASCSSLTTVSFQGNAPSIGATPFAGDSGASITYLPGTTGWSNPFAGLPATAIPLAYTVSNGAVTITGYSGGGGAFTIPGTIAGDPVVAIGASAFANASISSITIPGSVSSIGADAFESCSNLTTISFLGNAPTTASTAFQGDTNATIIYLPSATGWSTPFPGSGGITAEELAFTYSLTAGAVTITGYTGSGGAVTIPSTIAGYPVTSIGTNSFDNSTTVTRVVIPSTVTSIGAGAFVYCSGMTSITIPASVTSIGDGAFEYCSSLTNVTIPSSVTSVGNEIFQYCSSLTSVTLPGTLATIGDEMFQYCTSLATVTIPSGVTSIGFSAFANCSALARITIPGTVTSIAGAAFQDCTSLTTISIPASVTSIGVDAFQGCTGLTTITVVGNAPATDSTAFQGDTNARIIYAYGTTGWTDPFAGIPAAPINGNSAPVFSLVASPSSITVAAGRTVVFNVAAAGAPSPAYQWTFNGSPTIPGAATTTDSILMITGTTAASAGTYTCTASNLVGSVSSTATLSVNSAATNPGYLTNLSGRGVVGSGLANGVFAGFGITGTGSKQLLIRGIGPGLYTFFQLSGYLSDPLLTLYNSSSTQINQNGPWGGTQVLVNAENALGAFPVPTNSLDAMLYLPISVGNYSAEVSGVNGSTGIALAEIYDADAAPPAARLNNISVRTPVGTGSNILFGGFVIGGSTGETVLIRAIGPSLYTVFNLGGYLAQPILTLYSGSNVIYSNTIWGGDPVLASVENTVGAYTIPTSSQDSLLLVTLPPGAYSAQIQGVNNTVGIATVEIYEVY